MASLSWVTAIELENDGTLTLHVKVEGFEPTIPVEISGYATQANGAVASFYDIQKMPANGNQGAEMEVTGVRAAAGVAFDQEQPFTVVARAADVWITTLTVPEGVKSAWKSNANDYRSALYTDKDLSLIHI